MRPRLDAAPSAGGLRRPRSRRPVPSRPEPSPSHSQCRPVPHELPTRVRRRDYHDRPKNQTEMTHAHPLQCARPAQRATARGPGSPCSQASPRPVPVSRLGAPAQGAVPVPEATRPSLRSPPGPVPVQGQVPPSPGSSRFARPPPRRRDQPDLVEVGDPYLRARPRCRVLRGSGGRRSITPPRPRSPSAGASAAFGEPLVLPAEGHEQVPIGHHVQ